MRGPPEVEMVQTRQATLDEQFALRHPKSAALFAEAQRVFPSGVTHDGRYTQPYPIYVTHARGSRKWDADGHEYVDYFGGHGALILGHCHPAIVSAVTAQAARGSHFGANHELEVRWGQLVQKIVPCAQNGGMVKFVSSGTEATLMAMRLARAYTGRDTIVKFRGHFHGWHDYATVGMSDPWDQPSSAGIPRAVQNTMRAVPVNDVAALEQALSPGDVAAVIILLNGLSTEYLTQVRDMAHRHGTVLIFDEVITGFRYAPGGAQEYKRVTPDLTTHAKILAGGYPGGGICGSSEILRLLEHRDDAAWQRGRRIAHPGTFNANPVSSAAGIACLEIVQDPAIQRKAAATADTLRAGLREKLERRGIAGSVGGEVSLLNVSFSEPKVDARRLTFRFRTAMQMGGVDFSGLSAFVSAVHDDRDVEQTVRAFDQALVALREEGAL